MPQTKKTASPQLLERSKILDHVIEIEELTKTYPNGFTAVSHLSLKVPRGIFGFLGPNGSGKTTTIEVLVGAMKPTSGTARVLGYDIVKQSIEVRKLIGYVPEHPGAYDDMSGLKFLRYMGELSGLSVSEVSARSVELLEWVGLGGWRDAKIGRYSAGMRQRLALAQALINDPKVIFLDEPTANLDPLGRADLVEKIRELATQGKTVFLSTHIIPEAEQVVDHVAIINEGKLAVQGSVKELTRGQEAKEYKIRVSKPRVLKKELEAQDYIVKARLEHGQIFVKTKDDKRLQTDILKIGSKHNMRFRAFEPVKVNLQEIFRKALEKRE